MATVKPLILYSGVVKEQQSGDRLAHDVAEYVKTSTATLTADECRNSIISNYGQGAAMTLTLPTAAAGLNFIVAAGTTGYALHIKAGSNDKIYLDGVALDDGDKISLASPAVGNSVVIVSFKSGASAWDWIAETIRGVWTDGGA